MMITRSGRSPAEVFPPGDFLREELEARKWTQSDLQFELATGVSMPATATDNPLRLGEQQD
jgi:hypothetical protein